ncbi:HK97 gp10 family phage protein [Pseudoroseomonas ludipueritiae]|uniref:HK97 gp10 family phage protein n=1 Tax=Pseudoroseomonas ludipueritiae TaxID=198093 RepID=A0ABR7R4W4_9PROT|nr:HK97 gp10 family phage protein [Pseudoroseomonas ludipueritiae]MBC9176761.1 HK97 gp10 family phage protein [Pseudoroseomonas ludipueritiae]
MSGSAFSRQVNAFVSRNLSPAEQSKILARVAREGRDELIRSGRASPSYRTFVDGREGADEASVKPDGAIVYRFSVIGEAAAFAMAYLRARSPVRGGKFRDSWIYAIGAEGYTSGPARGTYHNGAKVAASFNAGSAAGARIIRQGSFDPQKVGAGVGEILITNLQPYERLQDVQLAGNRRLRFSVPPNMVDDAAVAVRRRFPTLDARRVYTVHFPGQYILKTGQKAGRPVENPALVISVR